MSETTILCSIASILMEAENESYRLSLSARTFVLFTQLGNSRYQLTLSKEQRHRSTHSGFSNFDVFFLGFDSHTLTPSFNRNSAYSTASKEWIENKTVRRRISKNTWSDELSWKNSEVSFLTRFCIDRPDRASILHGFPIRRSLHNCSLIEIIFFALRKHEQILMRNSDSILHRFGLAVWFMPDDV